MNKKIKIILLLSITSAQSVKAGGYDPCSDYPTNYILWLIALTIVFLFGLLIARLFKLKKNLQTICILFMASLCFLFAVVSIPPVKKYLDDELHQRPECFFPSTEPINHEENSVSEETNQPKLITRDQFRNQIMNQTQESVVGLIGKPDSTSESSDIIYWYYHNKTIDTTAEKIDYTTQLVFQLDAGYKVVKSINFN